MKQLFKSEAYRLTGYGIIHECTSNRNLHLNFFAARTFPQNVRWRFARSFYF
ncbi:MAG: hypothetical protein LBJ00_17305 [Planctomycetaceae bacterium]|nr:hypothetical protein [Planctomycetaceae bacterium]